MPSCFRQFNLYVQSCTGRLLQVYPVFKWRLRMTEAYPCTQLYRPHFPIVCCSLYNLAWNHQTIYVLDILTVVLSGSYDPEITGHLLSNTQSMMTVSCSRSTFRAFRQLLSLFRRFCQWVWSELLTWAMRKLFMTSSIEIILIVE